MPAGAAFWRWSAAAAPCWIICVGSTLRAMSRSSASSASASSSGTRLWCSRFWQARTCRRSARRQRLVSRSSAATREVPRRNLVRLFLTPLLHAAGTQIKRQANPVKVRVEKQIGSSVLSLETGYLAKQAQAAVLAQYGETVVICAVASGPGRPGIDFFPLTCDYRERTAAAGKFPGGFIKREGRPTTKETLTARLCDRPIRPLFPKGFHDEVQCQAFVLASDKQNDGDVIAMNGVAAALFISPL